MPTERGHALVTRIPLEDLAKIDKFAAACGLNRSQFTAALLHSALKSISEGLKEDSDPKIAQLGMEVV